MFTVFRAANSQIHILSVYLFYQQQTHIFIIFLDGGGGSGTGGSGPLPDVCGTRGGNPPADRDETADTGTASQKADRGKIYSSLLFFCLNAKTV